MLLINNNTLREEKTRYHKVYNPFKRSADGKRMLPGTFSRPEFEALLHAQWEASEKLDGTNIRVTWTPSSFEGDNQLMIDGRKANSQIPGDLRDWLMATFDDGDKWCKTLPDCAGQTQCDVTLYGEGVGPGLQKMGKAYGDEKHFVLFDVRINNLWLTQEAVDAIAEGMGIRRAPVMAHTYSLLEWMAAASHPFNSPYSAQHGDGSGACEGFMARPVGGLLDRHGERIITKVKVRELSPDYVRDWINTELHQRG